MSTQPLTFSPEHIKYSRYIPSHIPEEMYNGIQKLFSRNDREALKIPMGNQQPSAHYAVSIPLCVFEVEHKGEDWESLEKVRLPLCLNLSQCKLELGEYQEVVDLNSKLMNKHKGELIHSFTAEIDQEGPILLLEVYFPVLSTFPPIYLPGRF